MSFVDGLGDDWIDEAADDGGEVEQEEQVEVKAEPEAEQQEPKAEPEPEQSDTGEQVETRHTVPYAEMKREREKRQELERRLQEIEQSRQQTQQPAPQPQAIPDAYEQPEEFAQHLERRFEDQAFMIRLDVDGRSAERTYGKEETEAAVQWAMGRNDPALGMRMRQSPTPVELVVKEYRQSRTLEVLGDKSAEDFAREYAEKQGWIVSQPGADQPPSLKPSSPKPPRSLASKPGSGGVSQTAQGDGFEGIFKPSGMGLMRG